MNPDTTPIEIPKPLAEKIRKRIDPNLRQGATPEPLSRGRVQYPQCAECMLATI